MLRVTLALAIAAALGACGGDTDTATDTASDATTATTVATTAAVATTATTVATATTTTTTVSVKAEPGGEPVTKTGTLTGDERDAYSVDVTGGAGERVYASVKGSKGEPLHLALYDPAKKIVADGASKLDHQVDESGKYLITVRSATPRPESTSYTIEIGVSVPAT